MLVVTRFRYSLYLFLFNFIHGIDWTVIVYTILTFPIWNDWVRCFLSMVTVLRCDWSSLVGLVECFSFPLVSFAIVVCFNHAIEFFLLPSLYWFWGWIYVIFPLPFPFVFYYFESQNVPFFYFLDSALPELYVGVS